MSNSKQNLFRKRRLRVRNRLKKNASDRVRMSIHRSSKNMYVQLIDDSNGKTLASASSRDKDIVDTKKTKIELSKLVGISIGSKAIKAGVSKIGFDRNGYLYHGRVKSLAEGAREAGLKF